MSVLLKKLHELEGVRFFIPAYQRGYRWTNRQINELLDDINALRGENWYCLQPIVILPMSKERQEEYGLEGGEWFEVVDGQQRITTIALCIHYMNELQPRKPIKEIQLYYETKPIAPSTRNFLEGLEINMETHKAIWPWHDIDDFVDYYYLTRAYEGIDAWYDKHDTAWEDLKSKLRNRTQVIWYELEDDLNPIDSFIRTNMGKIPLEDAELIKALFLMKEKSTPNIQITMALEWDTIEYALQKADFWGFLRQDSRERHCRIDLIFKLLASNAAESLREKIGNDKYSPFRYLSLLLEKQPNNSEKVWNEVLDCYQTLEEWYNNADMYHFIGWLLMMGRTLKDIFNKYQQIDKTAFEQYLENEVKSLLLQSFKKPDRMILSHCLDCAQELHLSPNQEFSDIYGKTTYVLSGSDICNLPEDSPVQKKIKDSAFYHYDIQYWYNDKHLRELFILLNILALRKHSVGDSKRLPFHLFNDKTKWDIEHIDSNTDNQIKKLSEQQEWLNCAKNDIDELPESVRMEIDDFLTLDDGKVGHEELFSRLRGEVVRCAKEDYHSTDEEKKNIGNLTLLNARINRKYGNALFPTKRRIIIQEDSSGEYIPECTRNVFFKYFDVHSPRLNRWGKRDMQMYKNYIGNLIAEFLDFH